MSRSTALRAVTFRPDSATLEALKLLEARFKPMDRSDIIRDAIKAYERHVLMEQVLASCRMHGEESERVVEEFEEAGDGVPD